ncbi:MAG: LPS assembly protein LptD [Thermoanaerobaculia bacterium]
MKAFGAICLSGLSLLASAAALAQDPFAQGDPFESRFKQRANFQIKVKTPTKGGEVRLFTKKPVRFEKDKFWEGSEEVLIEYQDVKITCDQAHYDFPSKIAVLTGHVVIDQGPTRLTGTRGTFHFDTKTGVLEDATADLPPTFHIVAQKIEKIGEATYKIDHGIFTACEMPRPEWSFSLSEATVTLDDYARMKNVAFRAGPVPLLYTPYLIWPTKEDRASGMLVPGIGYSNRRGGYLGLSYYWVTGRPTDFTTQVDAFTDGTFGVGQEARWRPTPESVGLFQGYIVRDKNATVCVPLAQAPGGGNGPCTLPDGSLGAYVNQAETRWKVRLDHVSDDLPYGFRGVLSVRDYSDQQFLQDFERSFALNSARQIISRGFLTKNVGMDSLNLRFERSETFYSSTVIQERFPTIEFLHRTAPVAGSPIYLALESSLSALYIDRGRDLPRGTYGRFDLHPVFSFPFKTIPWLSLTARAGGRFTGYTTSTNDAQTEFTGDSVTRALGEGGLSLVGPSFSRIYDVSLGPWDKLKHVIEPRVEYDWVSNVSDPTRIPAFDEIDQALGLNQVRYSLVNRLLAKPAGTRGGSAEEIASLEIAQTYAFELPQTLFPIPPGTDTRRRTGPIEGILRLSQGGFFHLDGRLSYDTFDSQVTSASVTAGANWKTNYVNLSWFGSRPVPIGDFPVINSDQFRVGAGLDLGKNFRLDTQIAFDATQKLVQEDRSLLTYKGSCYTVFLEIRELRLPPAPRRDYRIVVNLKDIGTLLDINGSLDALLGR